MRLRYEDGWLEVDFNNRGSNFERVVKCSEKTFETIEYDLELLDARELHELVYCILDKANSIEDIT